MTLTVTAPNRRSSTGGGMATSYACPGLVSIRTTNISVDGASACRPLRGSDAKGPLHSSHRRGTRHTKRCEATQAVSAGLRRGDPSLGRRTRREAAGQLQSPHPQSVSSSRPAGMSAHDDHPPGDSDHDHHDHEHDPAAAWSDSPDRQSGSSLLFRSERSPTRPGGLPARSRESSTQSAIRPERRHKTRPSFRVP